MELTPNETKIIEAIRLKEWDTALKIVYELKTQDSVTFDREHTPILISDLSLTARVRNALIRAAVYDLHHEPTTLDLLLMAERSELGGLRNVGNKTIKAFLDECVRLGIISKRQKMALYRANKPSYVE